MATLQDVQRIAITLPGSIQGEEGYSFAVLNKGKQKGFAWVWMERVHPKNPKVPNPEVIALRVADEEEKQMLIASNDEVFFTEPHYNGFPAILVRLPNIEVTELAELITDAWRCQAPAALIEAFDAETLAKENAPSE